MSYKFGARSCAVILAAVLVVMVAMVLAGCGGSGDAVLPSGTARIIMVDAPPSALQGIFVQLTGLNLYRHSAPATVILDEDDFPGAINLLDLAETPLVFENVTIPSGNYTAARLLLNERSPHNTLTTADGTGHPWTMTHSDADGNMRLVEAFRVDPGEQIVLFVDFAAAASVYQTATGAWQMRPVVFVRKLPGGTTVEHLASVSGTVLDRAGQPVEAASRQVLGLVLTDDTDGRRVGVTEIDPVSGEFTLPNVPPGRYRLSVHTADRRWEITSPRLPLQDAAQDYIVLRITAGENRTNVRLTIDQ